jgi:hypothetical protein
MKCSVGVLCSARVKNRKVHLRAKPVASRRTFYFARCATP